MNKDLRRALLEMQRRDQEMRLAIAGRYAPGDPVDLEDVEWTRSVDAANTARMKAIITQQGWPGRSLVRTDGARAAWLLVQHAAADPAFQRRCLDLLKAAVDAGEAEPRHLAYLTDRVRVAEGKPQLYGTQLQYVDGELIPLEIEDEDNVDAKRSQVGLEPLAEYLKKARER